MSEHEGAEMMIHLNNNDDIQAVTVLKNMHRTVLGGFQTADVVIGGSLSNPGQPGAVQLLSASQLELEDGWALVNINEPMNIHTDDDWTTMRIFPWHIIIDEVIDAGAEGTLMLCAKKGDDFWVFNVDGANAKIEVSLDRAAPNAPASQKIVLPNCGDYVKISRADGTYRVHGRDGTNSVEKVVPFSSPPSPMRMAHAEQWIKDLHAAAKAAAPLISTDPLCEIGP